MEHLEHPLSTSPTRPNEWNEMQISLPNEAPLRPNGSTCLMNEVERFRSGSELKPAEKKPTLSFWENDKESITFFELFFRQIRRRTPCPTWSLLYSVNHLECPRSLLVLAGSLRSFSSFLERFLFLFFLLNQPHQFLPSFRSCFVMDPWRGRTWLLICPHFPKCFIGIFFFLQVHRVFTFFTRFYGILLHLKRGFTTL